VSSLSRESSQIFFSKNQKFLSLGKKTFNKATSPFIRHLPNSSTHNGPYFLLPIPYVPATVPEDEKEADPSDGKPPLVKLLLDSHGNKIDNPTVQVQPIFNGGTTAHFLKWFQILSSLLEGKTVGEHFRLALQAL
jgi:hypothetical protein